MQASKKAPQAVLPKAQLQQPKKEHREEEKSHQSTSAGEMEWEQTKKKKKKEVEEEKIKNCPPKQRKKKTLPKALLVSVKNKETYADILRQVNTDLRGDELGESIDKVRRTRNDKLLLVLNRRDWDKISALHQKLAEVVGSQAEVIGKCHEVELSIRDLEEITTVQDIKADLQNAAGSEFTITDNCIRALHPAYGGRQIASVKLPNEIARKVTGERGRIRIGLVNCSIKEVDRPTKCFKCWNPVHIARACPSDINRSHLCLKCGQAERKIAKCENEPHCPLCDERGKKHRHIVGSYRCFVFQVKNKKRLPADSNGHGNESRPGHHCLPVQKAEHLSMGDRCHW